MDVGLFKTSSIRLKIWLIIPPLLIVILGLGSRAWRQRAQWQLQKTRELSEMLPQVISVRRESAELFDEFRSSSGDELGSADQLISFLQEIAQQSDFMVDVVNMIDNRNQEYEVPVLHAVVRGRGNIASVQLYINTAKSEQKLLSVDTIRVQPPSDGLSSKTYDVEIVFELLLLDELKTISGEAT